MKKRTLLRLLAFLVACPVGAYGQLTISEYPVGARNVSLVNANIAEASDVSVVYQNPAPLAFLENKTAFLNHSQGNGSSGMQENFAVPLILGNSVGVAFGLDAFHEGVVDDPAISGLHLLEFGYDVAVAVAVAPTLSLGGSAALRRATMEGAQSAWGSTFNFGIDYVPSQDISYGLVYGGLGNDLAYSVEDSGKGVTDTPLHRFLEVGASMTYPSSASFRPPLLVVSFANEKIFGRTGLVYKAGIEIRPWTILELRFGYLAGPGLYAASYGLGFLMDAVSVQYAISPLHTTKILRQQFSLSLEL